MRTGFAVNTTNSAPPPVLSVCIHSSNTSASRSLRQSRATPPCGPEKFQPVSKLDAPQTGVCRFIFAHLTRYTKRRCVDKYIPQSGGFFVNV